MKSNSTLVVKGIIATDSVNKKIINEDVYNISLCKENGSVIIRVGWTIRFACDLNGLLNETLVRWFKDKKKLPLNNDEEGTTLNNNRSAENWMKIMNASLHHSGEYSCAVDNKTCHTTILVKGRE